MRAQRIGYPPPPRSGWSGVCRPRCPACPISNYKLYLMVPGGPPRALKCPRQPATQAYLVHFFDLSWPSLAIFGHLSPSMLPRSSQLDAKIARESPTCGQDRPKYSPRASNQTPQDPKMWPKRCSVVRFYTSAIFLKIAPKTTKNAQKSSPHGLKMAILIPTWPQDGHLGPNLGHLGAILAPTWSHLGPVWRDFGRSEPGQN